MNALLISTYELGHQPFGLASPAAWLRREGIEATCLDLSQQAMRDFRSAIEAAELIAFYVPMHTATRIAAQVIGRVRQINPRAYLAAYGLYAPNNAELLRSLGVKAILGGEFEAELAGLAREIRDRGPQATAEKHSVSLARQQFLVPERGGLPGLAKYAQLVLPSGEQRVAGYTEASRGCKHLCRHCPIVPVYQGAFRVVQPEVVLEDLAQQVRGGAQHVTFGDPDFFNGPRHAVEIVQRLHREFPDVSYDVTVKVEHLLKHVQLLPVLRDTGCAFVTTAVESFDDRVLELLDKGHTRADFFRLVRLFRDVGLALAPTFVAFTPWTTLDSYEEFLEILAELGLVQAIPPIQLAIRLLIPAGSRLLALREVEEVIGPFGAAALSYSWANPDARVDELQRELEQMVQAASKRGERREAVFSTAWDLVQAKRSAVAALPVLAARSSVPYLTEPWYC